MSKGNICTLARRSSGGPAHFVNLVFKCIHLDELFNLANDVPKFFTIRLSILSGLSLSLTHNGKFPIFRGDKKGTLYHLIENLPLASVAKTICKLGGPLHVTMETDAQ